jgi:hypothetical protein
MALSVKFVYQLFYTIYTLKEFLYFLPQSAAGSTKCKNPLQ